MPQTSTSHFSLVTAGHHFLLNVLPFRRPDSLFAVKTFVAAIERLSPSLVEVDAILLRCLTVLDMHTERRFPSLVDTYLSQAMTPAVSLACFSRCTEDFLRLHCVGDGNVQQALQLVDRAYCQPNCTPRFVADALGQRLPTLDVVFRRETGRTLTDHIRTIRLERAALLLATTKMSIKEVWAQVGYNHHSNFDHDFKRHFSSTPREYRSRAVRPVAQELSKTESRDPVESPNVDPVSDCTRVLIVDDDESSRTIIADYLRKHHYRVFTAADASEGLRQAHEVAPKVLLLDHHLGDEGPDGLECLRRLRHASRRTPANVAIFTADWTLFDRVDEAHSMGAIVASKLCDLEQIRDLVDYLSADPADPFDTALGDTPRLGRVLFQ